MDNPKLMIPKPLKIELLWFLVLTSVSVGLAFLVPETYKSAVMPGVTVNIWDTKFGFSFLQVFGVIFSVLGVTIISIRAIIQRFRKISINLHSIFFLSLFIILIGNSEEMTSLLYYSYGDLENSWSIYSPSIDDLVLNVAFEESYSSWYWGILKLVSFSCIFLIALMTGKLIDENK